MIGQEGDVPEVSPNSAPLHAIFFLEQSKENQIIPLTAKKEIFKRLVACLIKPFETADWWEKELTLIEKTSKEVSCYRMLFDKSGKVVEQIKLL